MDSTSSPAPQGAGGQDSEQAGLTSEQRDDFQDFMAAVESTAGLYLLTSDQPDTAQALAQRLWDRFNGPARTAWVQQPRQTLTRFMQLLCQAFRVTLSSGDHPVALMQDLLRRSLGQSRAKGRPALLIVTQAHLAPFFVLRQLVALNAPDADGAVPLRIVLIGEPALRKTLEQAALQPVTAAMVGELHLEEEAAAAAELPWPDTCPPGAFDDAPAPGFPPANPGRTRPPSPAAVWRAWAVRQRRWLFAGAALVVLAVAATALLRPPPTVQTLAAPALPDPASASASAPPAAPPPIPVEDTPRPAPPPPVAGASRIAASATETRADTGTASDGVLLPSLTDQLEEGWVALGQRWGAKLALAQPCDDALTQRLQCYRANKLAFKDLQAINRPGLLLLRQGDVARWVRLEGIQGDQILLASSGRQWSITTAQLNAEWTGSYATLWRLPPGQTSRVYTAAANDAAGRWLNQQLQRRQQARQLPDGQTLAERIEAFQRHEGLPVDGRATPTIFVRLMGVIDLGEPRLQQP